MLHSVVCPSAGHAIVHHFGEGAAVWGQLITPSIAHLLQSERELEIDFSLVRPGIVFEVERAGAFLSHIIDASTLRVDVGPSAYRHAAAGRASGTIEAVVHIEVGGDCILKVWGKATADNPTPQKLASIREPASATSVTFNITFWEISRRKDARSDQLQRELVQKDGEIQELRAQVSLAMSSQ